ncbi:MAG: DNA/RNA non-specific endonuclease [Lachnospiraceae bacterium]|nr:DNA/RNA non-specific endonuclease [Lachnospiraceae bacterium]
MKSRKLKIDIRHIILIAVIIAVLIYAYTNINNNSYENSNTNTEYVQDINVIPDTPEDIGIIPDISDTNEDGQLELTGYTHYWFGDVPEFSGEPFYMLNNGVPFFTDDEITTDVFEEYSELDELGRCGVAYANICKELMPTEKRGNISSVKPSGWHSVKYEKIVSGGSLYNRCHLIGYQLAGENANKLNLITGTRYLNIEGMLPFEDLTDDYVEDTGNHVLYRVTPVFTGDNLVADGVLMEGLSVEDKGATVSFCAFCYNVQPGITIDYATGESWITE